MIHRISHFTKGTVNFYSNENFPLPVVEFLRAEGHDVLTSCDAGKANQRVPDDEVLGFAKVEDRVLLTFNRKDFIALHRNWVEDDGPHAGILVCKRDDDFEQLAKSICDGISDISDLTGKLIRINRPNR